MEAQFIAFYKITFDGRGTTPTITLYNKSYAPNPSTPNDGSGGNEDNGGNGGNNGGNGDNGGDGGNDGNIDTPPGDSTIPTVPVINFISSSGSGYKVNVDFLNRSISNNSVQASDSNYMSLALYTSYTMLNKDDCHYYNCSYYNNCPSGISTKNNFPYFDTTSLSISVYVSLNSSDWILKSHAIYTDSCISGGGDYAYTIGLIGLGFTLSSADNYLSPYFTVLFDQNLSTGNITFNPDTSDWISVVQLNSNTDWHISGISSMQVSGGDP